MKRSSRITRTARAGHSRAAKGYANKALSGKDAQAAPSRRHDPDPNETGAATILANAIWILGGVAVTWSVSIWLALTTFQPGCPAFFKNLNYSATVVLGMWLLTVVLLPLHGALHAYRHYTDDGERFPGQFLKFILPASLRWVRVIVFLGIVIAPSAAYVGLFDRLRGLSILHNDGSSTDGDSKSGLHLVTDWGVTNREPTRQIFHGWHWYSSNDGRKAYAQSLGCDAWPGLFASLHIAVAIALIASTTVAVLCPVRSRGSVRYR